MHQSAAMQFALVSLVGILVIVGFIYTTLNLIDRSIVHIIPPMLLPALAMCALAISDIRYLWLEQGQYCPSLRLAMDLARVFGTTVEDLFSFDDEYESESE